MNYLVKFSAKYSISRFFSNLQCLHLWLDVECNSTITWNFHVFLQFWIETSRAVSIPEESDMTKFDSLTVDVRESEKEKASHR
jgi:hypothetical protein